MTATAPVEGWEDTFTYHGVTYHVSCWMRLQSRDENGAAGYFRPHDPGR